MYNYIYWTGLAWVKDSALGVWCTKLHYLDRSNMVEYSNTRYVRANEHTHIREAAKKNNRGCVLWHNHRASFCSSKYRSCKTNEPIASTILLCPIHIHAYTYVRPETCVKHQLYYNIIIPRSNCTLFVIQPAQGWLHVVYPTPKHTTGNVVMSGEGQRGATPSSTWNQLHIHVQSIRVQDVEGNSDT